ncbi:MAG: tellurium resistance protein TerC [Bacteroidetes bacterium GWF2_43_63]|nr:MAG: tellurium resistance protein TerC [Bacteroidetes bacterium GWE2_42_42]OFY52726.1 MAG: tellurium resistance protein TerC [Bacteroidetes bacterium GWF2_43_63]HCB61153.1 tellurium resistance protein TerC [Bacteroidales bacterium]HCY23807.1 tellurium resistance protein TerC [Bacteroidales bacterium]
MEFSTHFYFWAAFIAVYLIVFVIDMYVTSHRKKDMSVGIALRWTALWVSIALAYGFAILFFYPDNGSVEIKGLMFQKFLAGYLTEYSLSIDNLFVFIMIFSLMGVHEKNQPKLLKLGILLSIVLRILFILVGMELVERFHWIIYIFGAILLFTAYKMAFTAEDDQIDPKGNFLYKSASKMFPVDPDPDKGSFFSRINGKFHITMVSLVFLVIGSTDVLFAVDSIPAIIGVIKEGAAGILTPEEDNFIAITSNVFAVMGLVSLFFALKGIMGLFRYLKQGVSFILFFIGVKMMLPALGFINEGVGKSIEEFFKNNSWISLTVIIGTLALSILLSIAIKEKEELVETGHTLEKMQADEPIQLAEIESLKAENERLKKEIEELKKSKN